MPNRTTDIELSLLLDALYMKYHYDFRGYSMSSVKRRMEKAKVYFECTSFSMLQDKLLHNPSIVPELLSYFTVQVSEFFRDPEFFRAIREKVVPHLHTYPSLKVWVAGCATGEELYSLVIMFREEGLEDRTIFYATDINTEALQKAEAGIYSLERIKLFTENHQKSGGKTSLSDYYTAAYNAATFNKNLRKRVVFSDHSLVSDEVFGEMQLISCRNVLIYFDQDLQDRAFGLFKDSLSHKGFLWLGGKETVQFSKYASSFTEFSRNERIYQKQGKI